MHDNMLSKEKTRKKILEAALDLFSRNGYEATTTKSIAAKSGANEVTIFRHFDTKKNLFYSAIEEQLQIEEALDDIDPQPHGDLKKDLTEIGLQMGRNMVDKSHLMKIVLMETPHHSEAFERISHAPFKALQILTEYFENAQDNGLMKDVDTEMAAIGFFSFFFRLTVMHAFLDRDPFMSLAKKNVAKFVDIFIEGLKREEI